MIRFEDLLGKVRAYSPDADVELLRRAYVFSALEHKGQGRHSGEPYLVHPLEVAAILAEMRMDPGCVAVGLLHDVAETQLVDEPDRGLATRGLHSPGLSHRYVAPSPGTGFAPSSCRVRRPPDKRLQEKVSCWILRR